MEVANVSVGLKNLVVCVYAFCVVGVLKCVVFVRIWFFGLVYCLGALSTTPQRFVLCVALMLAKG